MQIHLPLVIVLFFLMGEGGFLCSENKGQGLHIEGLRDSGDSGDQFRASA